MKILAIDDKPSQLAAISEMLRSLLPECEVRTADSGKLGLELARTFQPDTIILDIVMPGLDGFQVCRELKADGTTRHIPVVFLTGQVENATARIRGLEIGADAFLTHPLEAGELVAQVRAMLRIKRAEDALRSEARLVDRQLHEALEQQATILQTARDAFLLLDAQGRMLDVNEAACQLTGYRREELLRMAIPDLEVDESPAEVAAQIEKIKRFGAALFQRRQRRKDGQIIHVELSVNSLPNSQGCLVAFMRDISQRQKTEADLRLKSAALEAAANSIVLTNSHGVIEWVNPAFTATSGFSAAEAIGQNPRMLKSGKHEPAFYKAMWATILTGHVWQGEIINRRKDGTFYTEDMMVTPLRDERGHIIHFIAIKQDITRRKTLEGQLNQSQKMEAFGQLAGGVAHDFNNLLTIIQGNASLLGAPLPPAEAQQAVQQIVAASERAANLTRQLLAFSRQQVMQVRPQDLNLIVSNLVKMLHRIIGEDIALQTRLLPGCASVQGDAGMLELVLLNLAVNARDAMPTGGQLSIMVESVSLSEADTELRHPARPGDFIRLTVQDTGKGITPGVLPHIFEPFFTTKDVGKGTGLGLATVHGIVEQHHGWVEVESQLGQGAVFKVYLPRLADAQQLQVAAASALRVRGGTETILVVEDELVVRMFVAAVLKGYGYQVIEAASGVAAFESWRQHSDAVDLLLTDLIMPGGVSGSELALQLQSMKPGLKVIYMSGYPGEVVGRGMNLLTGVNFLQKPFVPAKLGQIVRDCLDGTN